jgi:hypothetical protein
MRAGRGNDTSPDGTQAQTRGRGPLPSRRLGLVLLASAVAAMALLAASSVAAAKSSAQSNGPLRDTSRTNLVKPEAAGRLRPTFHRIAGVSVGSSVDGTVLIGEGPVYSQPAPLVHRGTLVSASGATTTITPPVSCDLPRNPWPVVGHGLALYDCRSSATPNTVNLQVLTPPSENWTAVPGSSITALCTSIVTGGADGECAPAAVGRVWVEVKLESSKIPPGQSFVLINRTSGEVVNDPTSGRVIANLNAINPAAKRCSALNAKRGDLVRFIGRVALVENSWSHFAKVQSCGSTASKRLSSIAAAGAGAIVWTTNGSSVVHAINARNQHTSTITIPTALRGQISGVAITNKAIYVSGNIKNPRVWSAPLPAALKAQA